MELFRKEQHFGCVCMCAHVCVLGQENGTMFERKWEKRLQMRLRGWEAEKKNQSEHALTNDKGEEKKKQEWSILCLGEGK